MATLVHQGKTVVSSEDSEVIDTAMRVISAGRSATFYLKPAVYHAIMKRYWTRERSDAAGLRPISEEQAARVKSDFGIEIDGYANSLDCPRCGHAYSTYEFIEQGFEEHGKELVREVFALKYVAVLQVHPSQVAICRRCGMQISPAAATGGGYSYQYFCKEGNGYGCCL
jgi:hypothetical protein